MLTPAADPRPLSRMRPGVNIRLRYQSIPADRQRIFSDIVKIVFHEFRKTDNVHFYYSHSEVIYQWKGGVAPPPATETGAVRGA